MSRRLMASFAATVLLATTGSALAQGRTTAPVANASITPSAGFTLPIVTALPGVGEFSGMLRITRFAAVGNSLFATGLLSGTLVDDIGHLSSTIKSVSIPVPLPLLGSSAPGVKTAGVCSVLNLATGPIDLNVLGLQLHLNEVALDLSADNGSLLGALICTITGLLGGAGSAAEIATNLNQLLSTMGG